MSRSDAAFMTDHFGSCGVTEVDVQDRLLVRGLHACGERYSAQLATYKRCHISCIPSIV